MAQSFDYQARPISTEYLESQREPQPSPPYVQTPPGQADDGGFLDLSLNDPPHSPVDPNHKYGSPYEATLNGSDGRQTMVASPGLESVHHMETEKESYQPGPQSYGPDKGVENVRWEERPEKRRLCGIPLWLFLTLLAVLIALAVGLVSAQHTSNLRDTGVTNDGSVRHAQLRC